jgi:uncharacterized phage infection (PIP) family protein YhgE
MASSRGGRMSIIELKKGKEIFGGFIVDNITIKDIELDEEKFNNLIVDELTREDLFNIVLAYRKQLKRKEQECEELKNFHINLVGVKECEIKELAELKAENKHLNDLLNQALKDYEKVRETLAEIKEIAEPYYTLCSKDSPVAQILQKINECEGENEV